MGGAPSPAGRVVKVALPALVLVAMVTRPGGRAPVKLKLAPGLPETFALEAPGIHVEVTTDPFALRVRDDEGRDRLATVEGGAGDGYGALAWTTGSVKYETVVSPGYTRFGASLDRWHDRLRVESAVAEADQLELVLYDEDAVDAPEVHVTVRVRESVLRVEARIARGTPPRAWAVAFATPADEGFLGLGERFNRTDQRGKDVFSWVEEGGVGAGEGKLAGPANPLPSGEAMTNYPVPYFLSTRGYGFWLDTSWRSEMNLASARPDAWRAWTVAPTFAYEIHLPRRADARPWTYQLIDRFTAATGRPMVPPYWAFGPRRRVDRGSRPGGVPELEAMRAQDLAVTSVDDAVHFLPAGSHVGHEAELAAWVAGARRLGYRVNGYFNTMVSRDPRANLAAWAADGLRRDLYVRGASGAPVSVWVLTGGKLQPLYIVDLASEAARAWFARAFAWALDLGYSGFMYDFGEYVPGGGRGEELHNLYPVLEARTVHDALEAGPHAGDWLAFMRSGYTGASAWVPMVWSGDPAASFEDADGLPSVVRAGINLGVSGVPGWGSDIGGYHCLADGVAAADEELLVRWIQLGALSPSMQDQNACTGSDPAKKASIWTSSAAMEAWRRYARLHTRLAPYLYALAQQAHATGAPILRHVFLEHPERADLRGVDDAFYLGPALFVAPVVARGAREKKVVLPDPLYLDWDTREVVRGGREAVLDAPLARLPLLLRAGQLLPLLDASIDTLAASDVAGIVDADDVADVYDVVGLLTPGAPARVTLADGTQLSASWDGTGDARKVRVELAPGARLEANGLTLTASGPRRIRWDLTLAR